jgi:hypothetical protein
MKTRFVSFLLVFVLLLALVPVVGAQGGTDLTCHQLSEADCAIVQTAMANSANMKSANIDFTMDFALGGLSTLGAMMGGTSPMGDVTMNVTGSGPLEEQLDAMPPAALSMDINASLNDGTTTQTGTVSLVVVDGVIYVQQEGGQWEGATFEDVLKSLDPQTQGMLSGLLGGDITQLPQGSLTPGDLSSGNATALLEQLGLGPDTLDIVNIPGFITQTRQPDEDGTYVFQTVIDSAPLFAAPEFQQLLNTLVSEASTQDPSAAQVAMLIPMLLGGASINVQETQRIGADDTFLHGVELNLTASLDLSALMGAAGGQTQGQMQIPPITLSLNFRVDLSDINGSFSIVAPEGAVMVDPADL